MPSDADNEGQDPDALDGVHAEDALLDTDEAEVDDAFDDFDAAELPPGLVWASIPEGSFEMGCSPGDAGCDSSEEPCHTVSVSGFEMTETEITQAQYEWVTGGNPSGFSGCADCPVENVSWHEARAFCEVLGGRLPSEAEWEYAARGGATTRYSCGHVSSCLNDIAWFWDNSENRTHPAGEKDPNAFGLYDMLGNVIEWMEECWHADYAGAPSMGEIWSGGDCTVRAVRGGACVGDSHSLRVSARFSISPHEKNEYLGFRCMR